MADFAGGRAGKILFERESLRGHPAQGGAPGQGAAADTAGRAGRSCETGVIVLQGNNVDRPDKANCNGKGWKEDVCYTLNTIDRPAICFKAGQGVKARSIGASETVTPTLGSEAGGNSVPAVCYPEVFHTLTAVNARNIESAQQPNCVCYDARGNGDEAHCPTLTGDHENRVTDYTAVAEYRSPKFGEYVAGGIVSTMLAHDFQGPRDLIVEHSKPSRKYIIRRLTPLECCRLQGFPDGWGVPDHKDKLSDEELAFWQQVRDTCASITGKQPKKYSTEALTKWYNGLHTDSAEYKMWGNGIALPCAAFVLEGIADMLWSDKHDAE